jgi:hypothetical protein
MYNAGTEYGNFGKTLLGMIQTGQITPQRAEQLKASVYQASLLGNTPQGEAAMQNAITKAKAQLPMAGYNASDMYRSANAQLSDAIKSGRMTVPEAKAIQATLFDAVRMGNTSQGYASMTSALNAFRNPQPQGGLNAAAPAAITPESARAFIATQPAVLAGYDAGKQYQDFSKQLGAMVQSGQLTPEQANAMKAPVFDAARLGNTATGQTAMNAALAAAQGQMPRATPEAARTFIGTKPEVLAGYDPGMQYQSFANELGAMLQSGRLTPQQANALKGPVYEATRLGNTAAGQAAMQAAIMSARSQMPQATPQGGLAAAAPAATAAPAAAPSVITPESARAYIATQPAVLAGYNPSQEYQSFATELGSMIQSGRLTPQQANAFKNPVYEATRLGNTAAGQTAMQAAIAAARGQFTPAGAPQPGAVQTGAAQTGTMQQQQQPTGMALGGLMNKYY